MTTTKKPASAGSDLVYDLEKHRAVITTQNWYWLGALPGCPRETLHIAGVEFSKMTEIVRRNPHNPSQTDRDARIGSLVQLTKAKVELLREKIRLQVIRFVDLPAADAARRAEARAACKTDAAKRVHDPIEGTGAGLEALDVTRRRGHPIRIPTTDDVKAARKHGRVLREYVRDDRDEPAARYLFAQLCANQNQPERSDFYPEPLEVTGLKWPDE